MSDWDEELVARLEGFFHDCNDQECQARQRAIRMGRTEHESLLALRAQLAQRDEELAVLREEARAWEALAREAVEEFDDARGYASDGYASAYFTKKWGYNETSVRFQERLAALSDNQEGR